MRYIICFIVRVPPCVCLVESRVEPDCFTMGDQPQYDLRLPELGKFSLEPIAARIVAVWIGPIPKDCTICPSRDCSRMAVISVSNWAICSCNQLILALRCLSHQFVAIANQASELGSGGAGRKRLPHELGLISHLYP